MDRLNVDDLITCSGVFREIAASAKSMEEAAQAIVVYRQREMVDEGWRPATVVPFTFDVFAP